MTPVEKLTQAAARRDPGDISDPDSIHAMAGSAVERFGKLNLAANVAGVPQQPAPLAETTLQVWDRTHGVNDRGLFLCLQAQIPRILQVGGGAVVNVLSLNGLRGFPQMIAYGRRRLAERLTQARYTIQEGEPK